MGSDQNVAAHAYYPRLAAVLGVTGDKPKQRLQGAYQSAAERLWRGLNDWLTMADGRYGVPTAFALTHRYIGLPMSQALVRASDRRHLVRMFLQFGLPPGSDLPPADMRRILETWIGQVPSPASKNLQALWNRTGAQERIAEVAATELANWDNSLEAENSDVSAELRTGDIRLMAQLRRFPRPELQLSFLATMPGTSIPDDLVVESADDAPRLDVLPLNGRSLSPRTAGSIDARSLVEGVLRLLDPHTQSRATRHPHRVVPLRRDELTNAFVESERVQLGEDSLLLVKDERGLADEVEQLLKAIARPGFERRTSLRGLPERWCLFTDVQVLMTPSSSPTRADLNALVPLIASQLTLAGGLKLPGNLRKWSGLHPPEIRAVSQMDGEIELSLSQTELVGERDSAPQVWRSHRGILLVDLNELGLEDGDYEVLLDGGGQALQRTTLRLRSADTPDRWSWDTAASLGYVPERPLSAVGEVPQPVVRGALLPRRGVPAVPPHRDDLGPIWWSANRPPRQDVVPIVIASPDPTSCVVTGAHRIQLPPTPRGRPTSPMLSGSCTQCGIVKRYPSWPRRSRQRRDEPDIEIREADRLVDVSETERTTPGYDVALDALMHLGGGPASALDRVASQIDASALATDSLRRNLEALAHIDLRRNERQEVTAWSIAPPALAEVADGSFYLVGAWSQLARARLAEAVDSVGGGMTVEERTDEPTSWFAERVDEPELSRLLPDVRELLPVDTAITITLNAAQRLLQMLPPLSSVAAKLLRVPMPGARKIERFNVGSVHWEPVGSATTPGAYRLISEFRTLYVHRSELDIDQQEAAVGTAQLVKHIEALRTGRPLLAHYPRKALLAVPLGAELPGLYGRAAVLNSGCLPRRIKNHRAVAYQLVGVDFAGHLFDLLSC
jgi:hypothetical protein